MPLPNGSCTGAGFTGEGGEFGELTFTTGVKLTTFPRTGRIRFLATTSCGRPVVVL